MTTRHNVWAVKKGSKLVMVCLSKQAAWEAAASLLDPLPVGMPTRHDVMAQGWSVAATYLTYSPDAARHWVQSRAV